MAPVAAYEDEYLDDYDRPVHHDARVGRGMHDTDDLGPVARDRRDDYGYAADRYLNEPAPRSRVTARAVGAGTSPAAASCSEGAEPGSDVSAQGVAVVGAGPAGLACAHRLAAKGHDVVIFEARPKPGGLNEYGIASYKAVDGFAAAEVHWLLGIGGIELRLGQRLGEQITLAQLHADHDAVFLGMGLPGVNDLGLEGDDADNCIDAVAYIEKLRQTDDLSALPVGRNIVVIGGGCALIDAGTYALLLGGLGIHLVEGVGLPLSRGAVG